MSTDQQTVRILTKKGTDGFRGRRIKFAVYFRDSSCAFMLNYIKLTDVEMRRMAIQIIQKLRKCTEPEALIRYIIGRRTLRYDTGEYYSREVQVKCNRRELEKIFLNFVKESSHIPHLTIEKKTNLNEIDEEFAKMGIERGMPMRLTAFSGLPISILRLQIENYFNGGPFAHVRYHWKDDERAPFDLNELLSGFPIHYSPPIYENRCDQQHFISFRRKEGDPIFRLKIVLPSSKDEQRCCTPSVSVSTDIVGERPDISYNDMYDCCFEYLFR